MANSSALEVCERWRLRGNEAYEKGNLSRAEDCYTRGVKAVPCNEWSGCCLEPVVLCYSNRAATRMRSGRIRDGLKDCLNAIALDPNFLKAQVRAANCHLLLGEIEDALQYFSKCGESGGYVCLDRRIILEAADGLQKAKKVAECTRKCVELLRQQTLHAASNALAIIHEALSLSSHSEILLQMKGKALVRLQKYKEVIQLCEQTLSFAERNFPMVDAGKKLLYMNGSQSKVDPSVKLWRWHLMSRSYFHLGELEVALNLIKEQELLRSSEEKYQNNIHGASLLFAATIHKLLHYEDEGKKAFHRGKYREAIKHFTAAISSNTESHPFTAICFYNRASSLQAMGQVAEAIADCNLAIAIDGNCLKAIYQRAALFETVRDYEQAASDLKRFISTLEKKLQDKGSPGSPTGSNMEELKRASSYLYSVEEKAKQGTLLDLYLILGVKASDSSVQIKKAYRESVLRHHPDKVASKFVEESGGDKQLWNEIADKIRKNAGKVYRMIADAYEELSDPKKRSVYDLKLEVRNARDCSRG